MNYFNIKLWLMSILWVLTFWISHMKICCKSVSISRILSTVFMQGWWKVGKSGSAHVFWKLETWNIKEMLTWQNLGVWGCAPKFRRPCYVDSLKIYRLKWSYNLRKRLCKLTRWTTAGFSEFRDLWPNLGLGLINFRLSNSLVFREGSKPRHWAFFDSKLSVGSLQISSNSAFVNVQIRVKKTRMYFIFFLPG